VKTASLFSAPPKKQFALLAKVLCILVASCAIAQSPTLAQSQDAPSYQRIFPRTVVEVRAVVQKVSAAARGRLPTLEGFVEQTTDPLDRYSKGFYECTYQVSPAIGGGTLVQATAKITGWYTDPAGSQSGYRVLVSNGRLENDALDRIEETLSPGAAANAASNQISSVPSLPANPTNAAAPAGPPTSNGGIKPSARLNPNGGGFVAPASAGNSAEESSSRSDSSSSVTRAPRTPVAPATALPSGVTLESLRAQHAALDKQAADLSDYIKSLEDIQRNQTHPVDLASVKKPKTPVFAKPAEDASVLMSAEAQDEFPVLGVEGAWVHVQISGASRGWMRRVQLEMPAGYVQGVVSDSAVLAPSSESSPAMNSGANTAASTATSNDPALPAPASAATPAANGVARSAAGSPSSTIFQVTKQESNPFPGSWAQLKGKNVRVEWVSPLNPAATTTPREKLAFAKLVFLKAYQSISAAHQPVDGIVVVFDSADGGQISATLATVKSLADRSLSDSAFWRAASLDPPDSFDPSGH
jgi:hypothetical protein